MRKLLKILALVVLTINGLDVEHVVTGTIRDGDA